jgi:hypothetical protein
VKNLLLHRRALGHVEDEDVLLRILIDVRARRVLDRLYPLVSTSSVFPSGLKSEVTACPAVYAGRSGSPGFRSTNVDPGAAVGVICCPVGMGTAVAA